MTKRLRITRKRVKEMSKKKSMSMADIRLRKTRLKDDLELLEGSFENRFRNVKSSILGSFNPLDTIRKKPLQSLGIAVAIGVVAGLSGKKKRKKASGNTEEIIEFDKPGFTGLLFDEAKRIAARRAAYYLSELVDQKLSSKK